MRTPKLPWRAWLREPLLQFLALGGLLFAAMSAGASLQRPVVRIEAAEIEQLAAYWELQSQRPPTRDELAGLIQERADEELLAREAIRLGLDKDDMIIRRRLAQKMAFVSDDVAEIPEPSEGELQAYYERHRDRYARPGRMALEHLFYSFDRTGQSPEAAAADAHRRLSAGDLALGDPSMLPQAYADVTEDDLARDYGPEFAAAARQAPVGRWAGPVRSALGIHVVRVQSRRSPVVPPLADVRDEVRAAWMAEQRQAKNRAFRASLRKRYKVEIAGLPQ